MTTINKQLLDLVDDGAVNIVPFVPHPIGIGYVRVTGKTVMWSVPFPENQSGVHEFDLDEVKVNGPYITFMTDIGIFFVSAVDEWVVSSSSEVPIDFPTSIGSPKNRWCRTCHSFHNDDRDSRTWNSRESDHSSLR